MSAHVQEGLKGSGVARVIVVLRSTPAGGQGYDPEPVLRQFVASEYGQVSAMAAAARGRRGAPTGLFFPNLGICLGTGDRPALARIRQTPGGSGGRRILIILFASAARAG